MRFFIQSKFFFLFLLPKLFSRSIVLPPADGVDSLLVRSIMSKICCTDRRQFFSDGRTVATTTTLHTFNGPLSGTTRVSRYQKGNRKTNLDFTEARDGEWQWHQLGHMQVCISLQTDNHASAPPLSFLQAGCPSCRPTNSVKALKA